MKHKMEHKKILLFVSLICLFNLRGSPIQCNDSLPLDPSIRSGKLANGLSYYLKETPDASEKAHMSLVVKVGSNHQKAGEFQFAHIVEHLGFSSGRNISTEKSSELFDEIGLTLAQLNGRTLNEYTFFNMEISGNNNRALEVGLLFFEDIIWNLKMTDLLINKERNAVYNELNRSELSFPNFLRSLRRKMIGYEVKFSTKEKNDHLTSFPAEAVIDFYRKWYIPANMALVITGNIQNIDVLENEIKKRFAKPAQVFKSTHHENKAREYLFLESQFLKKPFPIPMEEPELMRATLNFFIRDKGEERKNSVAGIKTGLTKKLLVGIMNRRLREMREAYNVNFSVRMEIAEAPFALNTYISFLGKYDEDVLKQIIRGFVDAEQNGFSINEFNEGKESLIQSINNGDTTSSFYWRNQITSHHVYGEALPANKRRLETTVLKDITLEEFNDTVKYYLRFQPDDIILTAHSGHPVLSYSDTDIRKWFSSFNETVIEPYVSPKIPNVLIDSITLSKLKKTAYSKVETRIPFAKAFELQNGIKVILKSPATTTTEKNEERKIHFQGYGKKGVSDFQKKEFFSAMNSPAIVINSGVGALDKFELERFLTATDFKGNVRPYIGYQEAGVKGSASFEDLEIALQLVYLYLTDPNFSESALQDWKKNEVQSMVIHQNINRQDFLNVIRATLGYQEFFPKGTKALEGLKKIDFTKVKEIYHQLFQNPNDLTFLFSGEFEELGVLDLCRKYLGNIPLKRNPEHTLNQLALPEPSGTLLSTIIPSTTPMELAKVRLVYIPKDVIHDFDWKEEIKIEIMTRTLTELVMRRLRFESATGGVYGAGAGRYDSKKFNHHETFIEFKSKLQDTRRLIAESKEVINIMKEIGPEEKLFNKIKKSIKATKAEFESPQIILQKMYDSERHGRKWVDLTDKQAFLESLTPNDILLTANKYLSSDPYEFIMVPK